MKQSVEQPIIFSGPMVRAYLEGRKSQTRRVIKGKWPWLTDPSAFYGLPWATRDMFAHPAVHLLDNGNFAWYETEYPEEGCIEFKCPYRVGASLWVRETWAISSFSEKFPHRLQVAYRAGVSDIDHPEGMTHDLEWRTVDQETWGKYTQQKYYSWQSSRFMPHQFSRILTGPILSIRAERLQEISPEDAVAEGAEYMPAANLREERLTVPQIVFAGFWDSLHPKKDRWADSPWVWRIEFPKMILH